MGKIKRLCLCLCLFVFQIIACSYGSFENPDKLYVEMLDVGQGLSFLIRGKQCNTLYDTGTPSSGIDTMLQNRGIKTLCSVIISHWHSDHYGGLPVLAEMAKSGKISIDRVVFANEDSSLAILGEAGIATHKITRNDTIADFLPWTTRILWPAQDTSLIEGAASIAVRINDPQDSFLFMGDLEEKEEKQIMELEPLLRATAMQIGNHGSQTSSSWEGFLAQIQPQMAFISAGKNNSYEHPHPETLEKLRIILQDTSRIFRTDQNGSAKIEWNYGIGLWKVD